RRHLRHASISCVRGPQPSGAPSSKVHQRAQGVISAMPLAKAHAWTSVVFFNEFDTSSSKYLFDDQNGFGVACVTADLDTGNGIPVNSSGFGQIANGPI